MKKKAIDKIKSTPEITAELTYGGCLLFDRRSGDIFHCCSDGKTYYRKWNNETGRFSLVGWQCGGLDKYDLEVLDKDEYQAI